MERRFIDIVKRWVYWLHTGAHHSGEPGKAPAAATRTCNLSMQCKYGNAHLLVAACYDVEDLVDGGKKLLASFCATPFSFGRVSGKSTAAAAAAALVESFYCCIINESEMQVAASSKVYAVMLLGILGSFPMLCTG